MSSWVTIKKWENLTARALPQCSTAQHRRGRGGRCPMRDLHATHIPSDKQSWGCITCTTALHQWYVHYIHGSRSTRIKTDVDEFGHTRSKHRVVHKPGTAQLNRIATGGRISLLYSEMCYKILGLGLYDPIYITALDYRAFSSFLQREGGTTTEDFYFNKQLLILKLFHSHIGLFRK